MDNSFFWDSSTQTIFCSSQGEQVYSLVKQVDKKSFMTAFPPLFRSVFHDVTLENKKVFIGVGPGSFTGVKSGIAFIGGWLFSKGKKDVNTVSSGDILSCYAPQVAGILAVVIPFNRREWFVSTYRFNDDKYISVIKDMHLKKESDWREYWGSSKELHKDLIAYGKENYYREILHLCKSKAMMNYLETEEQFKRKVLFTDKYYNGIINCRITARGLK